VNSLWGGVPTLWGDWLNDWGDRHRKGVAVGYVLAAVVDKETSNIQHSTLNVEGRVDLKASVPIGGAHGVLALPPDPCDS